MTIKKVTLRLSVDVIDSFELEDYTFAIHKTLHEDVEKGRKKYSATEIISGMRALELDEPDTFTAMLLLEEKLKDPENRKRFDSRLKNFSKKQG